ncbi:uncharacterized protein KY384_007604 [Bacidia gigantensis]|uniref:uncharacterized protein n=1 Tax=Bacidia gigantensis TaxID=2732470 RepID=UPI001D045449|nr:uncharacterized protein KY384_007604 [Bacidia gigantensis]KAG8527452.1 hypothetical protein KY384_007604 [Bacidia gigantensis]
MSMVKMCQVIFERLNTLDFGMEPDADMDHRNESETSNLIMVGPAVNGAPIGTSRLLGDPSQAVSERLQDTQPEVNGEQLESSKTLDGERPAASDVQRTTHSPEDANTDKKGDEGHLIGLTPGTAPDNSIPIAQNTTKPERKSEASSELSNAIKPYSLQSIRELFRVLIDLLRPQNKEHNDALRVMALRIIDVALEVAGPSIAKHPSLATLAKDDLCRYLFQLIRTDSTQLLNESLRVAGTLITTCREVLKLQQELFLSYLVECLHPQVEIPDEPGIDPELYEGVPKTPKLVRPAASQAPSGRSTPVPVKERHQLGMDGTTRKPDAREAMIESIGALSRIPGYLVELFINYDCEVDRNDLCEDLIGLLSRNAFPDSATWSTTSVPPLSLDSLLTYIQFIAERLDDEPNLEGYPDIKRLREQRARKKIVIKGATRFNADPRDGIAFLAANEIIDNPNNPQSVAGFLKSTTRIAKKKLGEYLSKRDQEPLLRAFLDLFDFTGKRVDEALRDLLNSFRLPGESQLIERIVTVFSQQYCGSGTIEGIANEDAVFTLTYSIIMLNTDQHNPNLKKEKRMTPRDFAKNLRGVNGGSDFDPEYLEEIYKSIKTNEIILPDEHNNDKAFHYTWEGLLLKAQNAGALTICNTNVFDSSMFQATWRPIIATLSYVFMSASDDAVFSRVILGFDQCAQISAKYGLTETLDRIIFCLSSMSSLSSGIAASTSLNTEVQVEKRSVMVSELAVKFGRDYKAQLACAILFRLIPNKEHVIKHGWKQVKPTSNASGQIVHVWLNLFANSLLPSNFLDSEELLDISPISLQSPNNVIDREQRNESGLLSSFTSYLSSYAADDPPEPSEEEVESTLCTVDCLASCPMQRIFSKTLSMPPEIRQNLVLALLKHLPEPSSPVVLMARQDQARPTPIRTNGSRKIVAGQVYNPSIAFILELSTILASQDRGSMALIGEPVADAIQNVVREASNIHPLVISRAVYYLLYLMNANQELCDQSLVKTPVVLHTISRFDHSLLEAVSELLLRGLGHCLQSRTSLRNEIINTPDFWLILSNLHTIQESAPAVLEIVENIVASDPTLVTADNYVATVSLLDNFATAGSIGAAFEQQASRKPPNSRDRRTQRPADPISKSPDPREKEVVLRGYRAVVLISQLIQRVPTLIKQSQLDREKAWMTYWSQIFQKLQTQCLNPCRKIRRQAYSALQTALLSPSLCPSIDEEWDFIFQVVLFGLISRLLKPEVYQTDPIGMNETRLQAANLLGRTFLHHLPSVAERDDMLQLWLRILDTMDRLMHSGQGDNLEEAIPESLKNILLVMAGSEILTPPEPKEQPSELWIETKNRVDRFLPNLMDELFPRNDIDKDVNSVETTAGELGESQDTQGDQAAEGPEESAQTASSAHARQPTVESSSDEDE